MRFTKTWNRVRMQCVIGVENAGDAIKGTIFALFYAFFFTLGSVFVQLLEGSIPDLQLNFYRCFGQVLCTNLLLLPRKNNPFVRGKSQRMFTAVIAISGAVQNIIIFIAVLLIPVGTVGSLFHATSVIFTIMAVIILRIEPITRRKIILTLLTLIGIFLTLFSAIHNTFLKKATGPSVMTDELADDTLDVPDQLQFLESNTNFSQSWISVLNQTCTFNVTGFSRSKNVKPSFWTSQSFGIILALFAGLQYYSGSGDFLYFQTHMI